MLAILIICLVIFGAISLPIGIAMGLATMLCLVFATNIDPIMVAQNAFAGIDSFSLMAIPFFMLAGNFMRYGGISKRLLDLADNIVGFFTGGLGAITTFTAMFYAAISGSGPATVSAIGSFMIPEMEEKGYDKGYATALSAAAGTIGVIIPPSIPFVIYGVATGTSIGDMFKAGTAVEKADLQPGDVVFFYMDTEGAAQFAGIYMGNQKFISCNNEESPVKEQDMSWPYYAERFLGARRYA